MDVLSVLTKLCPTLNAAGYSDLLWWTQDELIRFAAEAAERLGRTLGVFAVRDTTPVSEDQWLYTLPARHVSLLHAALDNTALRPATIGEIEALDDTWDSTKGTPKKYATDGAGLRSLTLYPVPEAAGTLAWIRHTYPALALGSMTAAAPEPVAGYFKYAVLEAAHQKESDGRMADVAQHAGERRKLYEAICSKYWGAAQ